METKSFVLQLVFSQRCDTADSHNGTGFDLVHQDTEVDLPGQTRGLPSVLCMVWWRKSIAAQSHCSCCGCMQLFNTLPCPEMTQWPFKVSLPWLLSEIFKIQLDKALGSLVWPPDGPWFEQKVGPEPSRGPCQPYLPCGPVALWLLLPFRAATPSTGLKNIIHTVLQFSIQAYSWYMSPASLFHGSLCLHSKVLYFHYPPFPSGNAPHRPTDCLYVSKSLFHRSQQNAELNIDF